MLNRKRLIYIYGLGRSGSTLLGQILGQSPESVSLGEFIRFTTINDLSRPFDDEAIDVRDIPCACSVAQNCPENALNRYLAKHQLFKVHSYFSYSSTRWPKPDQLTEFFESVSEVYKSYPESVVIDTSKNARILMLLADSEVFKEYDITGVFIYRNIFQVFRSWRQDKGYLKRKSVVQIIKNIAAGMFWSYLVFLKRHRKDLFIRFSDLRAEPTKTIERLNKQLGLSVSVHGNTIQVIKPSHEVAGNPSKFREDGPIVIS